MTPGSDAARAEGCRCPVIDNHGGRGVPLSTGTVFWINGDCPIHGNSDVVMTPAEAFCAPDVSDEVPGMNP